MSGAFPSGLTWSHNYLQIFFEIYADQALAKRKWAPPTRHTASIKGFMESTAY